MRSGYATSNQKAFIMSLYEQSSITTDQMIGLLDATHDGGYRMRDMGSIKKAVGYLSREEASEVIDYLKRWD